MKIMKTLICPKCKIPEEVENMLNREDCTIIIYNQNHPEVRPSDGLNIYPMICLKCKNVTEWASDPTNKSEKAIEGVEYFNTRKAEDTDIAKARMEASALKIDLTIKKLDDTFK